MAPPLKLLDATNDHTALVEGARILVNTCAGVRAGERVLILTNSETRSVGDYLWTECGKCAGDVRHETLAPLITHGSAPPSDVGPAMMWADVIFCLTQMSMAHTKERKHATDKGARFLSLPDYSLALLAGQSLRCDFHAAAKRADRLQVALRNSNKVRLTTALGTDLTFSVKGRPINVCPGLCLQPGMLGSPPDAEINIAPLEGTAEGIVHVDGSIPCRELGRLTSPVTLIVGSGRIREFRGSDSKVVATLQHVFQRVDRAEAYLLAEFGIGLNPLAELTGRMLEDEGCAGTIHLGFGSNATIGGCNDVPFHLDFVVREPTVFVDEKIVIDRGTNLTEAPMRAA